MRCTQNHALQPDQDDFLCIEALFRMPRHYVLINFLLIRMRIRCAANIHLATRN